MRSATKRRVTILATSLSVLLISAVAFAAWTTNGTGSGFADAGTDTALETDTVAASTASLLYPNGDADVRLVIQNDNPYNVEVTEINNTSPVSIESGDGTCDASHGVTFTNQSGSWVVPANGTLNVELEDAASMSNDSVNACKEQTFTIDVDLLGASTADDADDDDF